MEFSTRFERSARLRCCCVYKWIFFNLFSRSLLFSSHLFCSPFLLTQFSLLRRRRRPSGKLRHTVVYCTALHSNSDGSRAPHISGEVATAAARFSAIALDANLEASFPLCQTLIPNFEFAHLFLSFLVLCDIIFMDTTTSTVHCLTIDSIRISLNFTCRTWVTHL